MARPSASSALPSASFTMTMLETMLRCTKWLALLPPNMPSCCFALPLITPPSCIPYNRSSWLARPSASAAPPATSPFSPVTMLHMQTQLTMSSPCCTGHPGWPGHQHRPPRRLRRPRQGPARSRPSRRGTGSFQGGRHQCSGVPAGARGGGARRGGACEPADDGAAWHRAAAAARVWCVA